MKKVYLVITEDTAEQHAGQKARKDIAAIARRMGMKPFVFWGTASAEGHFFAKLRVVAEALFNWARLLTVPRGSLVLFQYPHRPVKTAFLTVRLLPLIRRIKKIRFAAIVHDLDSLRGLHGQGSVFADRHFLPLFDQIICHNDSMKQYLMGTGIPGEKLVVLGLFDYLCREIPDQKNGDEEFSLCIAGNLSREQSGYVYQLIRDPDRNYPIHLFGPGFEWDGNLPEDVIYHGVLAPDDLPSALEGRYGLVWGGDSLSGCEGVFGEYLRYNDPHKLSLYLASGRIPVIWSQAAAADFVRKHRAGISVDSLEGLREQAAAARGDIDKTSLQKIQRAVVSGGFFRNAMKKILSNEQIEERTDE